MGKVVRMKAGLFFILFACVAASVEAGGHKAAEQPVAAAAKQGWNVPHSGAPRAAAPVTDAKTKHAKDVAPSAADLEVHGFAQRQQGLMKRMRKMDQGEAKIAQEVTRLGRDIHSIAGVAKKGAASNAKLARLKQSLDNDAKHDLWKQEGKVAAEAQEVHGKADQLVHAIGDERALGEDRASILSRAHSTHAQHVEHVDNPVAAERQILHEAKAAESATAKVAAEEDKAKSLTKKMAVHYNQLMADYQQHDLSKIQTNDIPGWARNDVHELGEMGTEAAAIAKAEKTAEHAGSIANQPPHERDEEDEREDDD